MIKNKLYKFTGALHKNRTYINLDNLTILYIEEAVCPPISTASPTSLSYASSYYVNNIPQNTKTIINHLDGIIYLEDHISTVLAAIEGIDPLTSKLLFSKDNNENT